MNADLEIQKKRRGFHLNWEGVALFLAFFAPFAMMMAIFIGNGIFPFGKRSFMFSDMYHQYVPFFQEFTDKLRAGEGLDYSWNVGMGSNFLALYVYYLASPFNWLAFLLPSKYVIEFMSYAVVVKIGLAGMSAYAYLRSREEEKNATNVYAALICSTFYAMSGFVAAYNWDVMWIDSVVLFPLILMGLERLVRKGKTGLYVLTLGLGILTNFYLSIMICLFLVLYFIYLFLAEKRSFAMVWKFAVCSLLAGGLAAVLLVPEVTALLATDFGDMDFPKEWKAYFSIFDVLARHCMGVTTERALEHWPNIYSGCMVFLLIPLYAVNERIPARKRFGFLALAGIFLLGFSINGLDFIWHGLNYPDSLPARQSFLYSMIVLVMCHECLTHPDGIEKKGIIKAYLGAVLCFLCIDKFVDVSDFQTWIWLMNLGFVTVYAICLYLRKAKTERLTWLIAGSVACIAVLSEAAVNMAMTSVGTTDRTAYLSHREDYQALYARNVKAGEFKRFEKFSRKTKNDATFAGFPSASLFSSTMNSYVMDFYTRFGMQHSKVYYGYDGATAFSSALLNVGYLFADSDEWENELFRLVDQENGIYLYEATYQLPFGYVAPIGFDLPEEMKDKGITLQNEMMNQLGIDGIMLKRVQSETDGDDVVFKAKEDGIYYGCVTNYGTSKIKMTGAAPEERNFKDLKRDVIFYVGELKAGQTVYFTNGDSDDDSPKIGVNVYKLNVELMARTLELLGRQRLTEVNVDNREVTGKLSLEEAGRLILSIPYEKGWKIYVNGEEKEPAIFGDAFLALDLEPGSYELRLSYAPAGKGLGICLTAISLGIAVVVYGILPWRKKHGKGHGKKALEKEGKNLAGKTCNSKEV